MAEISKVVYLYAKHAAIPLKNAILALENWFLTDGDERYLKYLHSYLENRRYFLDSDEPNIIQKCDEMAKKVTEECHNIVIGSFFEGIKNDQRELDENIDYQIRRSIDDLKQEKTVDLKLLHNLRKREEEVYK